MYDRLPKEERIERGRVAQGLLDEECFANAVREIRASIWRVWQRSKPVERELRERLYQQQQALELIVTLLTRHVNDGRIAAETAKRSAKTE